VSTALAATAFVLLAAAGTTLRVQVIAAWEHEGRPLGTLAVNLAGSLVAGLAIGMDQAWATVLVTGGAGALTTFSTFVGENVTLARAGRHRLAAAYLMTTLAACTALAWLGLQLNP
jgi:CrcB protein